MRLFLLYDPDGDSRSILGTYLRHRGHQVLDTGSFEDAVSLAREHSPDAVVSELAPISSRGASLLETLRLDPATALLPVLVWTSRVEPSTVGRVEAHQGVFLAKPTSPSTVYGTLIRMLDTPPPPRPSPRRPGAVRSRPGSGP